MKIFWAQGVVCPCPGAIYMYMTKIFKQNAWPIKAKLCGASLGRGNDSLYKWSRSCEQDGRQGYKKQKPLKIFSFRTRGHMILKLNMNHLGMELYKVCIDHDPGMTLTYLTAKMTENLCL